VCVWVNDFRLFEVSLRKVSNNSSKHNLEELNLQYCFHSIFYTVIVYGVTDCILFGSFRLIVLMSANVLGRDK
jgi:hypothetical protein